MAFAVFTIPNMLCVNADSIIPQKVTEVEIAEVHDGVSARVAQQIQNNQVPEAKDVLSTLQRAGTPIVSVGDISDASIDFVRENIAFNAATMISKPNGATARLNGTDVSDEIAVSLYQFAKDGELVSMDEIQKLVAERPTSDSYSGGFSEYQTYGTITVYFAHKPGDDQKWTITRVTVMSNWGTSVNRITRIDFGAEISVGHGTTVHDYMRDRINNPGQGQSYTTYTGFDDYIERTNIVSSLDAGADFYLSNGRSFTLAVVFQDNELMPYGHDFRVDEPYVHWD